MKNRQINLFRSILPNVFYKKLLLKRFAKFIGKDLFRNLNFNEGISCGPETLLESDSRICVLLSS